MVLNGAPRSAKSSIVAAIQERSCRPWMNLGVDVFVRHITPPPYRPGIGLRPGGERPDLEPFVAAAYEAMYESVIAHSRRGLNVVVDVGHHDAYARPLQVLPRVAELLRRLPAWFVGVRCPLDVVMRRRDAAGAGHYATSEMDGGIPEPVLRWQREVHRPGVYDLEVDTSLHSPAQCADVIHARIESGEPPTAFKRIASA